MKRKFKFTLILLFILIIVFTVRIFVIKKVPNINSDNQLAQVGDIIEDNKNIVPQIIETKNTTLTFVGDMMLTRGVETSVKKNFEGDFNKLFINIPELKNADILFANLEGDVSDTGNNVGSIYSFRMNPNVLEAISNAGFDIVSFANNHIGDWNTKAFKDTLARLDSIGILKTGAGQNKVDAETPTIIEKNGVKFGFIGLSDVGPNWMEAKENTAGILLANDPRLGEIIQNAKTQCDVLIVSIHWGVEYKLIHNARQETLAKTMIDNGADMIIGTHPHVMEDVGEYNGKPIVYSLGNFIFDQYFSKDTMRGMVFSASFDGKNLIKTEQKIVTLSKKYQPGGIYTMEEIKEKDKILSSVCPKPKKEYEDMSLSPIGQTLSLADVTYIPKNLIELNSSISTKKEICLTKETNDAFEDMTEKAKEDGYTIKISSGFRSYETQKVLFANAIKNTGSKTSISVAKPGYSEHQLGTTADITGASINFSSANGIFDKTPENLWLKENAYLYGFVQSYPLGKEDATGYKYEPWHYRYVGKDTAKEMIKSNQTLNEFLAI